MKLQAIKKVCVAAKRIEIKNAPDGRQWIGNGKVWYPVDDDIVITQDNVQGLFDLDETQMEKITLEVTDESDPRFRLESVDGESRERLERHMAFYSGGGTYRVLTIPSPTNYLRREVVIVEVALLRPAETKDGYMEYRIRPSVTETGVPLRPLLAVYNSLMCGALVYPENKEDTEAALKAMRKAMGFSPLAGLGTKDEDDRKLEEAAEEYEREAEARISQLRMPEVTGDDDLNDEGQEGADDEGFDFDSDERGPD